MMVIINHCMLTGALCMSAKYAIQAYYSYTSQHYNSQLQWLFAIVVDQKCNSIQTTLQYITDFCHLATLIIMMLELLLLVVLLFCIQSGPFSVSESKQTSNKPMQQKLRRVNLYYTRKQTKIFRHMILYNYNDLNPQLLTLSY